MRIALPSYWPDRADRRRNGYYFRHHHLAAREARPSTRLMQFVASGLLGKQAFQGGARDCRARFGAALLYRVHVGRGFLRREPQSSLFLTQYPILLGMVYGLIVYAVMNLIVLPLSAATPRHSLYRRSHPDRDSHVCDRVADSLLAVFAQSVSISLP